MTYKSNQIIYVTFIVSETDTLKMLYIKSLAISIFNLIDEGQCDFTDGELTFELERYLNEEYAPTEFHVNVINWWLFKE